jgi:hypothetical protein
MAGSTITAHPAGTRRRTTRRRPSQRRRPAVAGSRKKRTRRKKGFDAKRWWPALVVAAAVLVGVAWDSESQGVPLTGHCTISGSTFAVTEEQVANARVIAQVAQDRGLPDRAVVIALATAQQESRLRNLNYGDRDSLGLFQQRPSAGWGTAEQVQDPVYAANKFYDHLIQVPEWETGDLTSVADSVQRSAYPLAYRQWSDFAQALTTAIRTNDAAAFTCA